MTLDRRLYILFRTVGHGPQAERAIKAFSKLGEHGLLWQAITLVGAAADPPRRNRWVRAWLTVVGAFGTNQLIKLAARRRRPDVEGLAPLMETMSQLSYPSAHATTSAAAARTISRLVPAATPAVYGLAIAMTTSRLYLGVHWPTDSAAGFALGTAVGELAS